MQSITVGFYGLTHLGLVSAVAAAEKGCGVIAYDADPALISNLKNKIYPIEEPFFSDMLEKNKHQVSFTCQLDELLEADFIYVAIDVPTDCENKSNLTPIRDALQLLRQRLRSNQFVVVLSQVSPGFMYEQNFPSNQLFYQVETLIFGRAMERATKPERFIIGCGDTSESLPNSFEIFLKAFHCPILKMRYESAELAKIAINMYLVSSVMTSNMLADLAASVGADWQEIVSTLRLDKRIGEFAYLDPGLGISGGNLERDMATIETLSQEFGVRTDLIPVWKNLSHFYKEWVWRCVQDIMRSFNTPLVIAILGLSYKPNTHSIKNSPSIHLLQHLKDTNVCIQVHDPAVGEIALSRVLRFESVEKTLKSANVLVIMTPWSEYTTLTADKLLSLMPGKIVIDPYHTLDHEDLCQKGFTVYTLGVKRNAVIQHPFNNREVSSV